MDVRLAAAWCTAVSLLMAGTAGGFAVIEASYAGILKSSPSAQLGVDWVEYPHHLYPLPLCDGTQVSQSFHCTRNFLTGVQVTTVTWCGRQAARPCHWVLLELSPDGASRRTVRKGSFLATEAKQWGFLPICFEPLEESAGRSYEITFSAPGTAEHESIGFPVYQAVDQSGALTIEKTSGDETKNSGESLALRLMYLPKQP